MRPGQATRTLAQSASSKADRYIKLQRVNQPEYHGRKGGKTKIATCTGTERIDRGNRAETVGIYGLV